MFRDRRGNRTQEVVGSIPISSTTSICAAHRAAAHLGDNVIAISIEQRLQLPHVGGSGDSDENAGTPPPPPLLRTTSATGVDRMHRVIALSF